LLAIGCDHVGLEMKRVLMEHLGKKGYACKDFGCGSPEIAQYPVYAYRVAHAVVSGDCRAGILICGTGLGMAIAAGKVKGIRAVTCGDPYSSKMAKEHNNANILTLGARVLGHELAKTIVDAWLDSEFEERHQIRLDMITAYENEGILPEE
jgi:ribose 5-phosphate isomerase B